MEVRKRRHLVVWAVCLAVSGCVLTPPGSSSGSDQAAGAGTVYQKSDLRGAWVRQDAQEMVLVFNTSGDLVSVSGDLVGVPGSDGKQEALSATTSVSPQGFAVVIVQYTDSTWELRADFASSTSLGGQEIIRDGNQVISNNVSFVRVD